MPFVVPNFNLLCNLWSYPAYTLVPPVPPVAPARAVNVPCALVYGHRTNGANVLIYGPTGLPSFLMNLLLPKGTDIRGAQSVGPGGPDLVEVPAGSGRWYVCWMVDDIGKGWANEHRTACLQALADTWSPPYT